MGVVTMGETVAEWVVWGWVGKEAGSVECAKVLGLLQGAWPKS